MQRDIINSKFFRLSLVKANVAIYIGGPETAFSLFRPASPGDLLALADQLQAAATVLRAYVEESDPGRAFEENQSLQFGAQKLEGDL